MKFPPGFLGTRADVLVDLVICSLIVFIPLQFLSYRLVKSRSYRTHRNIQLWIFGILSVVVSIFEWDIRTSGGILKLAQGGRFADTLFLKASFFVHLFFSNSTAVIWVLLVVLSLWKFPNPPKPGAFSRTHRILGRLGMLGMVMTALTGVQVYLIGFLF